MKLKEYLLFFTAFFMVLGVTAQSRTLNCKCGVKNDHGFRIVGGKAAKPHSFPWLAALKHKWFKIIFCGGSLINDRYVITAAHCVKLFPRQVNVLLGLHNINKKDEAKEFKLEKVLIHEGYKDNGINDINDLALLKLEKSVKFTNKIRPICLPTDNEETYAGVAAQVAGWGKTKYKKEGSSAMLKEADLQVISQNECKKKNYIFNSNLLDSMICAYQDNTDTCQGDSGGPLIYESPPKSTIIGVVSWGIECAKPDTPGVYTRITSYLDWIAENTKDASYCKNE